jgi:hypothetical protein
MEFKRVYFYQDVLLSTKVLLELSKSKEWGAELWGIKKKRDICDRLVTTKTGCRVCPFQIF